MLMTAKLVKTAALYLVLHAMDTVRIRARFATEEGKERVLFVQGWVDQYVVIVVELGDHLVAVFAICVAVLDVAHAFIVPGQE